MKKKKAKVKAKAKAKPVEERFVKEREQLDALGDFLYGPRWQSELGRALDVNFRTTRRWASGESRVVLDYWRGIQKLVHKKADKADRAVAMIDKLVERYVE